VSKRADGGEGERVSERVRGGAAAVAGRGSHEVSAAGRELAPVPVRELLSLSGHWSRRELRALGGGVRTPVGALSLIDRLPLGSEWTPLEYRGTRLEARLALPPMVLLDKPAGVECSRRPAPGNLGLFDLLPPDLAPRVQPVGRLDLETSGLLLLTGDGSLLQRLTHPKRALPRSYRAEVGGEPNPEIVAALLAGELALRDGHLPRPTELHPVGDHLWDITLTEGKYHEVRRIFAAAGAQVRGLRRLRYGPLSLADLGGAGVRRLPEEELSALYLQVGSRIPEILPEIRLAPDAPEPARRA